MRSLVATGWLTFRMRALLVSFASYSLWLHWRPTGLHLARHFLDFEPGIYWSQLQMQSGTTGINTLRIYNPTKQAIDQDPQGIFIRRWLPELAGVPVVHVHMPWTMPHDTQIAAGCVIGRDYPSPIVDHAEAVREAKRRLAGVRNDREARAEARTVAERHGSRKDRRGAMHQDPIRRWLAADRLANTREIAPADRQTLVPFDHGPALPTRDGVPEGRRSPCQRPSGERRSAGPAQTLAVHKAKQLTGQIGRTHDATFRVVVEAVAVPLLPLSLVLDRLPAEGIDLGERRRVRVAAHERVPHDNRLWNRRRLVKNVHVDGSSSLLRCPAPPAAPEPARARP